MKKRTMLIIAFVLEALIFITGKIIQTFTEYYSIGGYLMLFGLPMLLITLFAFFALTFSKKCPVCGAEIRRPRDINREDRRYATFLCHKCGYEFNYWENTTI